MAKTKPCEANYELNLLKGEGLRQEGLEGKRLTGEVRCMNVLCNHTWLLLGI